MRQKFVNFFYNHHKAILTTCILAIGLQLFYHSRIGRYFEDDLGYKVSHLIRNALSLSPELDPRIKIYALDNKTVNKLKFTHMSLDIWGRVLSHVSKNKPKMIIIDKKFGFYDHRDDVEAFKDALEHTSPLLVGAYTVPKGGNQKENHYLDLRRPEFKIDQYTKHIEDFDWLSRRAVDVLGPHHDFSYLFSKVGYLNYDHNGRIQPYMRVDQSTLVTHMALMAGKLSFEGRDLLVDGVKAPLDRHGLIPINFPGKKDLIHRSKSILPVILRADRNIDLRSIQEDDYVIILPLYFTGNADMGQTPLGRLPRGYVVASLINSILTKRWLSSLQYSEFWIGFSVLVGGVGGSLLSTVSFWMFFGLGGLWIFLCSLLAFCYFDLIIPWFTILVGFSFTGLYFFVQRMSRLAKISKAYELTLSGLVSKKDLEKLVKKPIEIDREARERLLTVIFVDMVGFSKLAEMHHPKFIFGKLKKTLGYLSEIVHDHGGVVDKTLGDGLLAFFGYNFIDQTTQENHADRALNCAIAMQSASFKETLIDYEFGERPIPLRIGINTAKVYLGDLGNENRVDFTMIGSGVNMAQRLESACTPYHILMSSETLDLSTNYSIEDLGMEFKEIQIKHSKECISAREYNPFQDREEIITTLLDALNDDYIFRGRAPRWPLENKRLIQMNSAGLPITLHDFSRTGFRISIHKIMKVGEVFDIEVVIEDVELDKLLQRRKLNKIRVEIKRSVKQRPYQYGVQILNADKSVKNFIFETFREVIVKI